MTWILMLKLCNPGCHYESEMDFHTYAVIETCQEAGRVRIQFSSVYHEFRCERIQ